MSGDGVRDKGRPTPRERELLALMWFFRIFGVVVAVAALLIAASTLQRSVLDRNGHRLVLAVLLGISFTALGIAVSRFAGGLLRGLRARIAARALEA